LFEGVKIVILVEKGLGIRDEGLGIRDWEC